MPPGGRDSTFRHLLSQTVKQSLLTRWAALKAAIIIKSAKAQSKITGNNSKPRKLESIFGKFLAAGTLPSTVI